MGGGGGCRGLLTLCLVRTALSAPSFFSRSYFPVTDLEKPQRPVAWPARGVTLAGRRPGWRESAGQRRGGRNALGGSGVRPSRSGGFQNARRGFRGPRPRRGFPRRPSHLHGAPLPRRYWPAPGPALPPSPPLRRRVPSPERPELRAAGGLLNRGGGGVSRGGSGARSGDESAAPRVGGGGRTARDRLRRPPPRPDRRCGGGGQPGRPSRRVAGVAAAG